MRNRWNSMLLVGWVLCASTAMAEPDTFGLGTGRDGVLTVTESGKVVNRYAQVTRSLAPGDSVVAVSAAEGFAAGDLVMVLQTAGILPEPRQGGASLITLRGDSVGQWELARIGAVDGQSLKLTAPLLHSFSAVGAQVIRVPEYTDVRVLSGASLVAAPWDGNAGGVLAFLASGTIHNGGALESSGTGFQGGRAVLSPLSAAGCIALPIEGRPAAGRGEGISVLDLAVVAPGLESATNGGGGGLCPTSGGGGGGNGAPGGRGGDALTYWDAAGELGGQGGAGLAYSLVDHLTLGGGGGQGYAVESYSQAGAGGGAIFIRGYRLIGGGTVAADGAAGDNSTHGGAGGGGAGGSVYLRIAELLEGNFISARGGVGGSAVTGLLAYAAPGGGGGGGRILYQAERALSFTGSVEAGLAGDWHFASTVNASSIRAQPTTSQTSAYRGTITQLAGGFAKELYCNVVGGGEELATDSCNAPMAKTSLDATITKYPINPTGSTDATFEFTGSASAKGFDCNLDGNSTPNCSSPLAYTKLAEGSHTFQVRAKDNSGNVSTPASYTWVVDITPPETAIGSHPVDPTSSPDATFTFTSSEPNSTFDCNLDGTSYPGCTSGHTYPGLSSGSHSFQVRAKDAADNVDPIPAAYSWVVDRTPPETYIGDHPDNPTASTDATFTFASSEPNSTFDCNLDGRSYPNCVSGQIYQGLGGGPHSFQVRAKDALDNVDQTPASFTWVVDREGPDTILTGKPLNPTNSSSATFTFNATELNSSFECSLDTGAYATCTSPLTLSSLASGSHTFYVKATDSLGNVGTPASYTWEIDKTAPDTSLTGAPPNPSKSDSATFTFSSTELGSSFECSLDQAAYVACSNPWTVSPLTHGSHTFSVKATDRAGNTDLTPASYPWEVDKTAPDAILTGKPLSPTNSTSATFTFSSTELGSGFECSLDSAPFATCGTPWTYSLLGEGSHTFEVRAIDVAGNVGTPASYTWEIDKTAPDTSLTGTPPNPSKSDSATFTFSSTEVGSSFECSLDGTVYVPCSSPSTLAPLAEGGHTFLVKATDRAGNTDQSAASYSWNIDMGAPNTLLTGKPPNPSASDSATFTFSSTEVGSRFECSLDSARYTECSSPWTLSALPEGKHVFSVRAIDPAGNVDLSPDPWTWLVDTKAPVIQWLTPENMGRVNEPYPTFTGTAEPLAFVEVFIKREPDFDWELAGKTYATPEGTWSLKSTVSVSDGSYSATAQATDEAGNTSARIAAISFIVDTNPPDTVIISGPPELANSKLAQFVVVSEEGAKVFEYALDGTPFVDSHAVECGDTENIQFCFTINLAKSGTGVVEGDHNVLVRARDVAGNTDPEPALYRPWKVAINPPEPPEIIEPSDGAVVYDLSPTMSGRTVPNGTVECYFGVTKIGIAEADDQGAWSFRLSQEIQEDTYSVSCKVTDRSGNESKSESSVTFSVLAPKDPAKAMGGGLGCAAASSSPWLAALGLIAGAALNSRRRRP